jgi:hypothetical protein
LTYRSGKGASPDRKVLYQVFDFQDLFHNRRV